MTRTSIILIATFAGLTLPVVASAAPKPADSEAAANAGRSGVDKPRRYCVVDNSVTGSRIATRQCKSLDAWLADGFDPRTEKSAP